MGVKKGRFGACDSCNERKMLYPEYKLFGDWYCYTCYCDDSVIKEMDPEDKTWV